MNVDSNERSIFAARDILLEDYRRLADSFWKNEQSGETRVNWLIGIVAAVAGGLVTLSTSEHKPPEEFIRLIIVGSLFSLLVFGFITLLRILKRNQATDGYKLELDKIRQLFKDRFDDDNALAHYNPFRNNSEDAIRKIGGLAHTVLAINSLLVGALAGVITFPHPVKSAGESGFDPAQLTWTYLIAGIVFCLTFIGQVLYVRQRHVTSKSKLSRNHPTHAGGVVYRIQHGIEQFLLVGPKNEVPNQWVFPKGHIESHESHKVTAFREVYEETGVIAKQVQWIGDADFKTEKEHVIVKYYLMECMSETQSGETRRKQWFSFEDAVKALTHKNNKLLLIEVESNRLAFQGSRYHASEPSPFETITMPAEPDDVAPDTSEIRLLPNLKEGGMCHCTLPPGKTSLAVRHRTVEEIWYFLAGRGQMWRKLGNQESVIEIKSGMSISIPLGTHFQFRNTGSEPLCAIIVTMPPWPGKEESVRVEDHWKI